MTDFRLCLTCLSYSQANIYHCAKANFYTPPLHFRRQPPQLNYQIYTVLSLVIEQIKSGISLICWGKHNPPHIHYHLFYTKSEQKQYIFIVKVHGVSSSNQKYTASSRYFQFHWDDTRDSGTVVIPFMQVGTYPTRNFATLGPLWLQPPFTRSSLRCGNI